MDIDIFKTSEEFADYLCWKIVSQLISISGPINFKDEYTKYVNSAINLLNIDEEEAFEIRQESIMSLIKLSETLEKRSKGFIKHLEERKEASQLND